MTYALHSRAAVSDLFGDRVIYRNLAPCDSCLPSLRDAWREIGLGSSRIPRKAEPAYGQVVAWLLQRAQQMNAPGVPLREMVYLGDTKLLDGTAFANLKQALRLPGWAFIASENLTAPSQMTPEGDRALANRWNALPEFVAWARSQGGRFDESTAFVVDLDKTVIGARGRNDKPIDQARIEGVERTVSEVLGAAFNRDAFLEAYRTLNQPTFHPFTADNQDYLAYICLIVSAGLMRLPELVSEVEGGQMKDFAQFIRWAEMVVPFAQQDGLLEIHQAVYARVQLDDPTPFKTFRRNEYLCTVARLGRLPDDAPLAERLATEICITYEVWQAVAWMQERGALLLALSDKPDEASLPTEELAAQGHQPLHRTPTHIVGEEVRLS
ncbi:MAG: hypothetical protein IT330_05490 [Anaerolineae bacterium]|nr:hypothetical protein [Anaerolineae bacterium]